MNAVSAASLLVIAPSQDIEALCVLSDHLKRAKLDPGEFPSH